MASTPGFLSTYQRQRNITIRGKMTTFFWQLFGVQIFKGAISIPIKVGECQLIFKKEAAP